MKACFKRFLFSILNDILKRIPKVMAKEIDLEDGKEVDITLVNNEIIIKPVDNDYKLNKLLKKINKNTIHKEIKTGNNAGKEIW